MFDRLRHHSRSVLITATILYILSLCPWLMWFGILLLGPDHMFFLLGLSWFTTILYPIIIIGSLFAGWLFQRRGEVNRVLWATVLPVLYLPAPLFIGFVALWQAVT